MEAVLIVDTGCYPSLLWSEMLPASSIRFLICPAAFTVRHACVIVFCFKTVAEAHPAAVFLFRTCARHHARRAPAPTLEISAAAYLDLNWGGSSGRWGGLGGGRLCGYGSGRLCGCGSGRLSGCGSGRLCGCGCGRCDDKCRKWLKNGLGGHGHRDWVRFPGNYRVRSRGGGGGGVLDDPTYERSRSGRFYRVYIICLDNDGIGLGGIW